MTKPPLGQGLEAQSIFPALNAQHDAVMNLLHKLVEGQRKIMAKIDDEAAALAANTAAVRAIGTAITGLAEGHDTIQAEIQALKDQIAAAGTPVDFTALDAAVADQTAAIGDLGKLVPTT